ncbi:hypothetical protein HHX47_DHR5000552 [Lentinula edodes]|nr:hypothetical protein HHX47_DHR5000552 [Lentinula edodes]
MEDGTPNAFSSATFRERDKAVQRKHDEDTRSFKVMLDKANHANAGLRASLFDLKNRSNRLVQSLGFSDLMEAQVHVDAGNSANRQMKYRDCLKTIGNLEDELKQAKILIVKMENRERELEEEYTTLRKAKDESASAYRQLCKENQNLQERFDATIKANCAAEERRRKDYDKWTHFKSWILCVAELEQFKQYEKEVGLDRVDRGDRAKELFRIVKGKKYKLSQLDSLEDQMLFDLAEQDSNESRMVPTPASIIRTENTNTAKLPSLTPFSPSSKANKPLNHDNLSPSPLFDPNTTVIPARRLIRSYAIKSTPDSPSVEGHTGLDLPIIGATVDGNGQESVGTSLVTAPTNEETLPPQPSTANSAPHASAILAPDSETEDESQSLRWSQFPPHAIITAPVTDRSRTPLRCLPQTNPSNVRAGPLKPIAHPGSATYSCPTPRIVASSDQPTTNLNAYIPQPHRPQRIRSPMLASIRRNANAKASSSSSHADSSPPARRSPLSPLSPTPVSRIRRAISPILPELENEDRLDEQGSELPPTKYRKSTAGRRIPSGSDNAAGKDDDRFRRKSAPSALTFEENEHANSSPSTMRHALVSRNKSRSRSRTTKGKEERDYDNYKENENTTTVDNKLQPSHSERRKSAGDRTTSGLARAKARTGEVNVVASTSKSTPKGPLDDYLMYKGRGRYGKNEIRGEEDTAINGMYEINPAQNAGLEYQYDEVVRGREKRKRLLGEDCDDCREYYEAVGPMPPRLQPPLWKSPVKDSHNPDPLSKRCPHHRVGGTMKKGSNNSEADDHIFGDLDSPSPSKRNQSSKRNQQIRSTPSTSAPGIAAHKQNISRHRAVWARGNTPPAYWDIGFPDTQRAEEINESAREMQRKKKEMIEMEAAREDGRYRRK